MSLISSSSSSMEELGKELITSLPQKVVIEEEEEEDRLGAATTTETGNVTNNIVVKRRRTKRQRIHQLITDPMAATSSTTSSGELSGSATEEEEDMANCLILLARGRGQDESEQKLKRKTEDRMEKFTSRRFTEKATMTNGKSGFYVYECKTCTKCFPSFQALGGHRASHKKPKTTAVMEENKAIQEDDLQITITPFPTPISTVSPTIIVNNNCGSSNKSRVHECSICGSEFSSGQALGGHMRRHRSMITGATAAGSPQEVIKKEKNLLSLDLNLPAPSDDECNHEFNNPPTPATTFSFVNKQQPILFSPSALVDCHY